MKTQASTAEAAMSEPSTPESVTLFQPRISTFDRADSHPGWSPSPELRRQITKRLQLVAITYSLAFFFADVVATLIMGGDVAGSFKDLSAWIPTFGSILLGIAVAIIAPSSRMSWQSKIDVGLAFEVLASYGIAIRNMHSRRKFGASRWCSTSSRHRGSGSG